MDDAKAQLAERLKTAKNVLVTVSRNPSVDQLSALLGLGLFLNKKGKHCASVFSGEIPSTLEFLQPESTIQKNTDSLRDFIIALDKSKADKLRYKVEDNIVRIFITPYRTSIGQDDLDFSQGDFNVDVIVALGVSEQADLDEAITAHGRILHDATVAGINVEQASSLGSINWIDSKASSLSELVAELIETIDAKALDGQIATALLTGIVSTTERFSNDKTSANTMSISSLLMSAGANQQLVSSKLEEPEPEPETSEAEPAEAEEQKEQKETQPVAAETDGTLEIDHKADDPVVKNEPAVDDQNIELPEPEISPELELGKAPVDEITPEPVSANQPEPQPEAATTSLSNGPKLVTEPPILGGTLTANSRDNDIEPVTDPLSMPQSEPSQLLNRKTDTSIAVPFKPLDNLQSPAPDSPQLTPPPANWTAPSVETNTPASDLQQVHIDEEGTLSQLEHSVNSPHTGTDNAANVAREEISRALSANSDTAIPEPIEALNAQPLGSELHPADLSSAGSVAGSNPSSPPPVPPPFNPVT